MVISLLELLRMQLLPSGMSLLVYGSSGFVVAEIYLTLNKLWSRKHEPQVVESISPMSKLVGLVPVTVFAIDGLMRQLWVVAIVKETLENPSHPRENNRVIAGAHRGDGQQAARIR